MSYFSGKTPYRQGRGGTETGKTSLWRKPAHDSEVRLTFWHNKGGQALPVLLLKSKANSGRPSAGLIGEADDVIGGAADNAAELFQRDHGDVAALFQSVQRLVIHAALQQLVLGDATALHSFPQGAVIKHHGHHLSSQIIIERKAEKPYCGYSHNMVE